MCRLFGLISNKEVNVEFSFLKADLPFENLSQVNPHGWGIGYYKNDNAKVQKQPIPAFESKRFQEIARSIRSEMFVSHVRYSTQGELSSENTHPFKYKNWIFAHNGNIDIRDKLLECLNTKFKNAIKGETDSEVFFYWLLQNIEGKNNLLESIKKSVTFIELNRGNNTTGINFILSNGEELIALRKAFQKISKYSLYYLCRKPNKMEVIKFQSKETLQLITSKNLKDEEAILVCSEKLTEEENWVELDNNQILIVKKNLKLEKRNI
ncbi:hypothetical protein LCGC14_2480610 [marine sediment metagenome]|uniref:Glutamine amidotransferase type-2 domain-containing protein n=1 Tax=marine sediment metagenome TaxID=412755 RepID=A0A0F9DJM7_9ZZZZ